MSSFRDCRQNAAANMAMKNSQSFYHATTCSYSCGLIHAPDFPAELGMEACFPFFLFELRQSFWANDDQIPICFLICNPAAFLPVSSQAISFRSLLAFHSPSFPVKCHGAIIQYLSLATRTLQCQILFYDSS